MQLRKRASRARDRRGVRIALPQGRIEIRVEDVVDDEIGGGEDVDSFLDFLGDGVTAEDDVSFVRRHQVSVAIARPYDQQVRQCANQQGIQLLDAAVGGGQLEHAHHENPPAAPAKRARLTRIYLVHDNVACNL